MTNEQKKMKRYMTAIERRLDLPREVRNRVMTDLQSSVAARREAGQSDETIFAEFGTPANVAAELNEQMKEYAYTKSKWRWAALAVAVFGGLMLAYEAVMGLFLWLLLRLSSGESASIGVIGGADGPTSIFVTGVTTTGGLPDWLIWAAILAGGIAAWWKLSHGAPGGTE